MELFTPVSHQQERDKKDYVEFWATHHHVWVLAIPVIAVGLLVLFFALVVN